MSALTATNTNGAITNGGDDGAGHAGTPTAGSGGSVRRVWATGAAAAAAAVAGNLAVWSLGRAGGVGFTVPGRDGAAPMEIGAIHVTATTLAPFVIGLVVFALVAARWRHGRAVVLGAAVVVTLGSLGMPLSLDTDGGTKVLLAGMHIVAGAAFVAATATATVRPTRRGR